MAVRYTKQFLGKLEDIFAESDYILRYEKGNFKSGYCVLKDTKIAIVNKYYTVEGKISCLIDILKSVAIDQSKLTDKNQKLLSELLQTELNL
jgi:mRNA-degrading endonuclease RelE of RelBE toxin-antitoxin system